ncbi:MAG: DUF4962 domain-containing protein [Verrucomicrobia bacterium]|nr:DUF4962 domain-containing protein [Verrucomicrobiota bacterium]
MNRKQIFLPVLLIASTIALAALDQTPTSTQKPYHPADNQVVEITPPPFIWVPAGRDATYTLQLSQDENFATSRTFTGLKRAVFVPRETLAAGKWFWRYGVGTEFGRARPFTVPATARAFPFPDFDRAVKQVPRDRPRLFFGGERLAQVRAAAKGELKGSVRDLVKSCERVVGKPLVPEPDYQPKEPGKRGPWAVNIMRTTRPPMDEMEDCALAYLLTGDKRLGLEAKRRLLYFFSWDPEGPTSFFAYDEPPMWVMMRGSRAYDWTYDLFTPEERAKIEPNMKARALQFLKHLQRKPFENCPYDSHAGRLPGFLGECALSFIHDWPEAREWLEYCTLIYMTGYPAWGGDDGGWQEGPGYWGAYMSFAVHFVVALKQATGIDLMQKPFFRNTPFFGLYTATPYHEQRPFGDGHEASPTGLGQIMYAFSSLTRDPYLRWYADECRFKPGAGVLSVATYDPTLKARSPVELPQARVFPVAGLVSMHTALGDRERDIDFLMRSSPYGSVSHGHADQNAFVINAFGRSLAIATGYYPWYGSPHHSQWTRATRSVNSILVDGKGQVQRSSSAQGRITAFVSNDGYDYTEGEAAPAYGKKLKRFRRHVVHVKPGVFVMFDDLVAAEPATFQWLLHAYEKIGVEESSRTLRVNRDPAAMEVRFLWPLALSFSQNDRYEPEPERIKSGDIKNTWHLTAGTTEPSATMQFVTVLMPHRIGNEASLPKAELVRGNADITVKLTTSDGSQDTITFGARVSARGVKKDGSVSRQLRVGE